MNGGFVSDTKPDTVQYPKWGIWLAHDYMQPAEGPSQQATGLGGGGVDLVTKHSCPLGPAIYTQKEKRPSSRDINMVSVVVCSRGTCTHTEGMGSLTSMSSHHLSPSNKHHHPLLQSSTGHPLEEEEHLLLGLPQARQQWDPFVSAIYYSEVCGPP